MQYVIMAVEADSDFAARTDPELADEYWSSWAAYVAAIGESGVMVSGAGLQAPATATTLRTRGGTVDVQDGPFADSKEQRGASSSSRSRIWMRHSPGPRAALPLLPVRSRSVPCCPRSFDSTPR